MRNEAYGTCIHCDAEHDLVTICITCVNETGPIVSDKSRKGTNTPVSHKMDGAPLYKIQEALNRLREEFGYGIATDCKDV